MTAAERFPEYFSIDGHPVAYLDRPNGRKLLELDPKTHQWVYAPHLFMSVIRWCEDENVESITKEEFERLVEAELGELPPRAPDE
jgi:hypothetical protein